MSKLPCCCAVCRPFISPLQQSFGARGIKSCITCYTGNRLELHGAEKLGEFEVSVSAHTGS